jgi:hypothetical protein
VVSLLRSVIAAWLKTWQALEDPRTAHGFVLTMPSVG